MRCLRRDRGPFPSNWAPPLPGGGGACPGRWRQLGNSAHRWASGNSACLGLSLFSGRADFGLAFTGFRHEEPPIALKGTRHHVQAPPVAHLFRGTAAEAEAG